jgi:hypothetical protein
LRDGLLKTVVDAGVPARVFFAAVVVGMDLTPDDFRQVARQPTIGGAATAGQFLVLPVIGGVTNLNLIPTSAQARAVVPPETWQASWLTAVEGGEEAAREQGLSLAAVSLAKCRFIAGSRNTAIGCKRSNARREELR